MLHFSTLDAQLGDFLGQFGAIVFYLVVWGLVFAGTGLFVGAFIPFFTGDTLLFASGLVTASTDQLNIWVLAIGVGIAAFIGDQVGFVMGRHLGRPYLDRKSGPRMRKIIDKVDLFYRKYGWWFVVVARFIPWARVFVPWVAGIGNMNYFKFLTSNLVGALLWGVGLSTAGFWAAQIPGVKTVTYAIGITVILLSLIFGTRTWLIDRRDRKAAAVTNETSDDSQPNAR